MKRAVIYVRVSTPDQHVESQLYDLRELAAQRRFEVVHEYEDRGVCGKKARRLRSRGAHGGRPAIQSPLGSFHRSQSSANANSSPSLTSKQYTALWFSLHAATHRIRQPE
jgi:hypothetical protein